MNILSYVLLLRIIDSFFLPSKKVYVKLVDLSVLSSQSSKELVDEHTRWLTL